MSFAVVEIGSHDTAGKMRGHYPLCARTSQLLAAWQRMGRTQAIRFEVEYLIVAPASPVRLTFLITNAQ